MATPHKPRKAARPETAASPFEALQRAPKPYEPPAASNDRMLTYTVRIQPVASRRFDLAALIGPHWLLDFGHSGDTTLNVAHWQGYTRIEVAGAGLFGATAVSLRDPRGGLALLDTKARMFVRMDESQILPVRVPSSVRLAATESTTQAAPVTGTAARQVSFDLSTAPRLQLHTWWIDRPDLTEFGDELIRVVFGEYDARTTADVLAPVRGLGIPVRTTLASDTTLVTSDVIGLRLVPAAAASFAIPESYTDMRSNTGRPPADDPSRYVRGTSVLVSAGRGGTQTTRDFSIGTLNVNPNAVALPGAGTPGGDDAGPPATHQPGTDGLNIPQCFPSTFGSELALVVEQRLLDDTKAIVNAVTSRLGQFSGSGGTITVNWLDQWRTTPQVWDPDLKTPTANQDGLYCLLMTPFVPDGPKPGLLVALAIRQIRRAIANGNLASQITLDATMTAELARVQALGTPDPFGSMVPGAQVALVEQYLHDRFGTFDLTYPTSTPLTKTFHDLIMVGLTGISFDVDFRQTAILTQLATASAGPAGYMGAIHLHVDLPHATMSAILGRFPSDVYLATLAIIGFSGGIFGIPALTSGLASAMVAAGLLIFSDLGYLWASLTNCRLDATISFVKEPPDPPSGYVPGLLRPSVTALTFDADAVPLYASFLPDTFHQLEAVVTTIIANASSILTDTLGDRLKDALDGLFRDTMSLRFPPAVGPSPSLPLNNSWSGASPNDHLYLQASLNAGAGSIAPPYVTQVDPNVHDRLLATRTDFFATDDPNLRRYAGFAISQNYLNQFINTRWTEGAFSFDLGMPDLGNLAQLIGDTIGIPLVKNDSFHAHLWPATSPRIVLTPRGQHDTGPYATTFFDDMRLCLEVEHGEGAPSVAEIQFAAEVFTQVGFGGLNPDTRQLDFGHVADAFFELYFDLDRIGVSVITPEVEGIFTTGKTFSSLTVTSLAGLEPCMRLALRAALAGRNDTAVPTALGDRWRQSYSLGAGGSLDVRIFPYRGNLYGWLALVGARVTDTLTHGYIDLLPGGIKDMLKDDGTGLLCTDTPLLLAVT